MIWVLRLFVKMSDCLAIIHLMVLCILRTPLRYAARVDYVEIVALALTFCVCSSVLVIDFDFVVLAVQIFAVEMFLFLSFIVGMR